MTSKSPVESDGSSAYYGRERLLRVLRQYEYWDDLIEACRSGYIEPTACRPNREKSMPISASPTTAAGSVAEGDQELAELRQVCSTIKRPSGTRRRGRRPKRPNGRTRQRPCAPSTARFDDPDSRH